MRQKGLIRPEDLFVQAMTFLEKVDLQELAETYIEQVKLLAKTQLMLDYLAEYVEKLQQEMPEAADLPEIDNPFRMEWKYRNGMLKIVIPGHLPRINYYDKDWRVVRTDVVKRLLHGLKDLPFSVDDYEKFAHLLPRPALAVP